MMPHLQGNGVGAASNYHRMMFGSVVVPDVLGLPYALACRLADEAELSVTGLGPDGRGVEANSDAAVIDQDPASGHKVHRGSRLVLRIGGPGGPAGDREPLRPPPAEHRGDRDVVDPDADPELAGAPA